MTEILHCPFCGKDGVGVEQFGRVWIVVCPFCEASGPVKLIRDEALKAGNTRADDITGHLKDLAISIYNEHYKGTVPEWEPLDDALGLITQIDNMTVGLTRANGWIPVSERLPEEEGLYLVSWPPGVYVLSMYFDGNKEYPFGLNNVTHWMPMPEPLEDE